jgi:hypothetical protein
VTLDFDERPMATTGTPGGHPFVSRPGYLRHRADTPRPTPSTRPPGAVCGNTPCVGDLGAEAGRRPDRAWRDDRSRTAKTGMDHSVDSTSGQICRGATCRTSLAS